MIAGEEQELELREIELPPNNMSHAVVRSGLEEGESVVINPISSGKILNPAKTKTQPSTKLLRAIHIGRSNSHESCLLTTDLTKVYQMGKNRWLP